MGVLKSFCEGALIQTSSKTGRPSFGGAKTDTGSSIISVLEVAESDFTRPLAETETAEDEADAASEKSTKEYDVSKATKLTDAKAMYRQFGVICGKTLGTAPRTEHT